MIVLFSEGPCRFGVRGLCPLELAKIAVRETDVVEYLCRLIVHPERAVAVQTEMEGLESASRITSNAGDGAEVLIDHRQGFPISDRLRGDARLGIHRLGEVEISARLVHDSDDVERLRDGG